MKGWMLVWLLLYITTIKKSEGVCTQGDIRVIGTNTTNLIAGRLELCYGNIWRVVCGSLWNRPAAMVTCAQLRFPREGAVHCTDSCFGRNTLGTGTGIKNFICTGNEESLTECTSESLDGIKCVQDAGVICTTACPPPPSCAVTTPPPAAARTCEPCSGNCSVGGGARAEGHSKETGALGGTLGALAALLTLILIGVVMGWVWSCYRRRRKENTQERDTSDLTASYASIKPYPSTTPPNSFPPSQVHVTHDDVTDEEQGPNIMTSNPSYATTKPHPLITTTPPLEY